MNNELALSAPNGANAEKDAGATNLSTLPTDTPNTLAAATMKVPQLTRPVLVTFMDGSYYVRVLLTQGAVAYAGMLSTTLLFALDNKIVPNIQPAIINDFGHL
ncbi:hypothetical protein BDP67DRAFT_585803 [Colletotrichum lupini]|nr:hypothetical protein BDP67DRAFT_585803 [Colletotrichum lupini]